MLLYHISQKENKFTGCVICKLRISQNIGSLNQGSRQEGWQLDKVHLQQQRCVLNPEHYYVTINTRKYTPSSKKYPCLTLSQAISQLFNQSNNQLVIHQSICQSDNLVSQSVSHWNSQSVIIESVKQSVTQTIKIHSVSFLSTCISLSTFKSVSESYCQPVNPTGILSVFYQPCNQINS